MKQPKYYSYVGKKEQKCNAFNLFKLHASGVVTSNKKGYIFLYILVKPIGHEL